MRSTLFTLMILLSIGLSRMKIVQEYIDKLLDVRTYSFDNSNESPNSEIIYKVVTSSKYRKSRLDSITEEDVRSKICHALNCKEPLKFSVPFGAYKPWYFENEFSPNWAEVINVAYLLHYASQISSVYPYGVEINYTTINHIMYFVSDISRDASLCYVTDFKKILNIFNKVSHDVTFNFIEIDSLYESKEAFYIDFLNCFLDNLVFWDTKYDETTKNRHLKSSYHNLNPYGSRKIGEKDKSIQEKYYYFSALMTDAVDSLSKRRQFNKFEDKIQLVGVKGPSKSINIGSSFTSTTHFWVSDVVLMKNKSEIKPFLFTRSKMENIEKKLIEVPVNSVFEEINKNFKNIKYFKEDL